MLPKHYSFVRYPYFFLPNWIWLDLVITCRLRENAKYICSFRSTMLLAQALYYCCCVDIFSVFFFPPPNSDPRQSGSRSSPWVLWSPSADFNTTSTNNGFILNCVFRAKQPLIITAWRATSLKPVSLKSSSVSRGPTLLFTCTSCTAFTKSPAIWPGDTQREWYSFSCVTNPMNYAR